MAFTCGSCGYYTEQCEESCPKCKIKLRMTFLPHSVALPEPAALPAPLAPGTPTYPLPQFRGSYDIVELVLRNRMLVTLIGVPMALFGFWLSGLGGPSGPQAKYNSIRMGMTADEVHDILFGDSRFRHDTRRVSNSGDSQMTWSEGPIRIIVYFRNGKVVNKKITGYEFDYDDWDNRFKIQRR
jgi:hypothetical protein